MSEDAGNEAAKYHDADEVEEAVHGLSVADHARLRRLAQVYAAGLGQHPHHSPAQDLLQEALERTLAKGGRNWPRGIDFVHYLAWAMKSIANSWRKKSHQLVSTVADDLDGLSVELAKDAEQGWLLRVEPGPDRVLQTKHALEVICDAFRADPEAAQVLAGWRMGLKGPEIQELSGMSKKAFDAAVRRIRYKLPQLEIDDAI